MTASTQPSLAHPADSADTVQDLALRLASAENALHAISSGQIDSVLAPTGKTYLLHNAQENLRRSEQELKDLLDSASDLIVVLNRGGKIVSQNKAAARLSGCERENNVGLSFLELVHPDDLPGVFSVFLHVIDGFRETATVEFRHRTGDGSGYLSLEASVNRLSDGALSRVVLICRDLSLRSPLPMETVRWELAQMEAVQREITLSEATQARDRFLARLARELSTPLMAPVLLCIEELQREERFVAARPIFEMMRRNLEIQQTLLRQFEHSLEPVRIDDLQSAIQRAAARGVGAGD